MTNRLLPKFCLTLLITLLSLHTFAQTNLAHDPTKPALLINTVAGKSDISEYKLQSIVIGKTRRLALINDKLVSTGDTVGSAKVVAIDRNSVILSESGRKLTIYLFQRGIWN